MSTALTGSAGSKTIAVGAYGAAELVEPMVVITGDEVLGPFDGALACSISVHAEMAIEQPAMRAHQRLCTAL